MLFVGNLVELNQIKKYVTHSTDNIFFICNKFEKFFSIILKFYHYKLYTENNKFNLSFYAGICIKSLNFFRYIKPIIFLLVDNIKIFTFKMFKVSKKLLRLKTKVLDIDKY